MAMDPFLFCKVSHAWFSWDYCNLLRRYFFRIRICLIARFRSEPLPTAYPVLMKQAAQVLFHADSEPLSEYVASRLEAVYPIFPTGVLSN